MPSVAVAIYVAPTLASNHTIWWMEDVCGQPLLIRLIARLKRGLPAGEVEYAVLCQEGVTNDRLQRLLQDTHLPLFSSPASSRLGVFGDFLKARCEIQTVMIYPENALFPDCRLGYRLLEQHRKRHAEGTAAEAYPPGLAPEIYQASALKRLIALELPHELSSEFHATMRKANQLFADDAASQFNFVDPGIETLSAGNDATQLPARLLVEDVLSWQAAERVIAQSQGLSTDSTDAFRFKEEILKIRAAPEISFQIPAPPPGKIPILYGTRFGGYTGAQECFFKIITHLDRSRFEPYVTLPYQGTFSEKLAVADIPAAIGRFSMKTLTPWSVRYFEALLARTQAQLVHIDGDPSEALVLAAFHAGVPFVYHLTEFVGRKAPPAMRFAARVVTISQAVRKDVLRSDIDPARVVTLFEAIDTRAFRPEAYDKQALRREAGISSEAKVITIVARVVPEKRIDLMIRALPTVAKKFPQALLAIVGESYPKEASYLAELKALVVELKMQDRVRFWGFERDIARVYALSDALVSCRTNEPVGHSILEALAMNVPVVVPNQGGHNEILRHNDNALLYRVNDAQSLAAELIRALGRSGEAARLAAGGRKTAEALDISQYLRKLEALYVDAISHGPNKLGLR